MNKKQLICMWIGIIAFATHGIYMIIDLQYADPAEASVKFFIVSLVILVITCGFIYTFKDKNPKDKQD